MTYYVSKDQGDFYFSVLDPFKADWDLREKVAMALKKDVRWENGRIKGQNGKKNNIEF